MGSQSNEATGFTPPPRSPDPVQEVQRAFPALRAMMDVHGSNGTAAEGAAWRELERAEQMASRGGCARLDPAPKPADSDTDY
jgi:hypothetical protein